MLYYILYVKIAYKHLFFSCMNKWKKVKEYLIMRLGSGEMSEHVEWCHIIMRTWLDIQHSQRSWTWCQELVTLVLGWSGEMKSGNPKACWLSWIIEKPSQLWLLTSTHTYKHTRIPKARTNIIKLKKKNDSVTKW